MTYSSDDVQQILQRAMAQSQNDDFSPQQLAEMATELGIPYTDLESAKTEWLTQRDQQRQQQQQQEQQHQSRRNRRRGFVAHLIPFVAVNTFLIGLNLITTPKHFWAIYPLSGWGLGLALHGLSIDRACADKVESSLRAKRSGCLKSTF
jgi:2TM domain